MAKQRDKRKKKSDGSGESGGGGVMTSFRSGMRQVAGTGGKRAKARTPMQKTFDIVFWVLILAAALFFIFGRMRGR